MSRGTCDAIVVGGGPAGLHAARLLAAHRFDVVVCEEHERIGDPVHCTGVVGSEIFDELDVPRVAILNPLSAVRLVSPFGAVVRYQTARTEAVVIDRDAFDRALAERAVEAGVELRLGARVTALEVDPRGVTAVVGSQRVRARLVVLASGASYGLQRQLGLGLASRLLQSAQCEVPAERLLDLEMHFGSRVAPEGFAWAVPVERAGRTYVRIGAMAARGALEGFHHLVRTLEGAWGLPRFDQPPRQKILPIGCIARTFSDRVLVVGDAAGLVKPTTGGGIYYGLVSASLAAEVAAGALASDRLGAPHLASYERRWQRRLSRELDAQQALRRAVGSLSDMEIEALFDLAASDGIMPIVRKTARVNRHRDLIRALFMHAPARRVLLGALA